MISEECTVKFCLFGGSMIKYEYETGMCKQLHYNGLWSVQYEGVPGHFKKVKMVCPCIRDECDQNCEVFKNIPEIKAADQEWHMRDER